MAVESHGHTTTITDDNFETEVKEASNKILVLIDFWADWCGPCKALSPVLEEIAKENVGKVKICTSNVETNQQLAVKYNVRNIPLIFFIKNGENVASIIGNQPKAKILEKIDQFKFVDDIKT